MGEYDAHATFLRDLYSMFEEYGPKRDSLPKFQTKLSKRPLYRGSFLLVFIRSGVGWNGVSR